MSAKVSYPTEQEIELTLILFNADHQNPDDHVLREHWDSWWGHSFPRAVMARYLRLARAAKDRFYAEVRELDRVWTGDDHTRRCPASFERAPCVCGYDSRLDTVITKLLNDHMTTVPPAGSAAKASEHAA